MLAHVSRKVPGPYRCDMGDLGWDEVYGNWRVVINVK